MLGQTITVIDRTAPQNEKDLCQDREKYEYEEVDYGYDDDTHGKEASHVLSSTKTTEDNNRYEYEPTSDGTSKDIHNIYGYDYGYDVDDKPSMPSTAEKETGVNPRQRPVRRNSTVIRRDDSNPLAIAEFLLPDPRLADHESENLADDELLFM